MRSGSSRASAARFAAVLYRRSDIIKPLGQLFVRTVDDGSDQPVPHEFTDDRLLSFAASPDERWLALHGGAPGETPSLHVMPLTGGTARRLTQPPASKWAWVVGWTSDGKRVLYAMQDKFSGDREPTSEVWSVPVDGGEPVRVQFTRSVAEVRVHPDNHRILYQSGGSDREVWRLTGLVSRRSSAR